MLAAASAFYRVYFLAKGDHMARAWARARKATKQMNMTSRFTLVAGVAGLIWAGCSAPAEEGAIPDPPSTIPPGFATGRAGSAGAVVPSTGGSGGGGSTPVTPVATGGSPTAPVSSGGAPAATGGTGAGGAPASDGVVPVGTGLALVPQADGWVPGGSNGLGIQGAFFAASDADASPTGTTLDLDTATTPGSVCVSGSLATIVAQDFTTYWGGTVGLNLRQVLPAGGGEALDASGWSRTTPAGSVTGFSYTLTPNGGVALPELRFTVDFVGKAQGDTFCDPIAGATSTLLADVGQSCWTQPTTVPLPNVDLLSIQWSLIPSQTADVPFDFCITNLRAIVQ